MEEDESPKRKKVKIGRRSSGDRMERAEAARFGDSSLARFFLGSCYQQVIACKFSLVRGLLLLLVLAVRVRAFGGTKSGLFNHLHTKFLPRLASLLKAYYVMKWLGTRTFNSAIAQPTHQNNNITSPTATITQNIGEIVKSESQRYKAKQSRESFVCLIAHLFRDYLSGAFFTTNGGNEVAKENVWSELDAMTKRFVTTIWSEGNSVAVAKVLQRKGQFLTLQEYMRLLDYKTPAVHYFLGNCFLALGQHEKSADSFFHAADGQALLELRRRIGRGVFDGNNILLAYFMHVMYLFEASRQPQLALKFATAALSCVKHSGSASSAVLWANVFKNCIFLSDYPRAYVAIVANPDHKVKLDCLRRFVTVLCTESQVPFLCSLPFVGLMEDVQHILSTKARMFDLLESPNYYLILYAFHMDHMDYRSAALITFEFATRLEAETKVLESADSIQRLVRAWLMCIQAMKLVAPEHQWFPLREIYSPQREREGNDGSALAVPPSPDGRDDWSCGKVVMLKEAEQKYALAAAHLELFVKSPTAVIVSHTNRDSALLTAPEVFRRLVAHQLFDRAVSLAVIVGLDMTVLFETLTSLSLQSKRDSRKYWKMVRELLARLDGKENNFGYLACVVERVLSADAEQEVPHWLLADFRRKHPGRLLELLISYGALKTAANTVHWVLLDNISRAEMLLNGTESRAMDDSADQVLSRCVYLPYNKVTRLWAEIRGSGKADDGSLADMEQSFKRYRSLLQKIERSSSPKQDLSLIHISEPTRPY
eukprot:TRINITY_DN11176_c0_g1_i1.p1 TRINITY_DN11176_c0_g1~~TRINITY_DN11176_c0_g1_i1.p1  ORF type:complete len:767 (+),score=149.86 TRINITY_DN11176_c0_g1_i1:235-2535(+)